MSSILLSLAELSKHLPPIFIGEEFKCSDVFDPEIGKYFGVSLCINLYNGQSGYA